MPNLTLRELPGSISGKGEPRNNLFLIVLPLDFRFYTVDETEVNEKIHKALADSPEAVDNIGAFFYENTLQLINSNSYFLVGKKSYGIDIVRDVLRIVPILWAASAIVIS